MHAVAITDYESSDIEMMDELIPESGPQPIEEVIADGAYIAKKALKRFMKTGLCQLFRLQSML